MSTSLSDATSLLIADELSSLSNEDIKKKTNSLEDEYRDLIQEIRKVRREKASVTEKLKDNNDKIRLNKQLPYLVANVVEVLNNNTDTLNLTEEEDNSNQDDNGDESSCSVVIKTTTRQIVYLPNSGLINIKELRPNLLVGVNKDSYLLLEVLPPEYDSRVTAMEIDERPQEEYSDIGGLDKQIEQLVEAIGVLMYGPPGTGKTLLARACAAQTKATFLKLAGPQLVQMFIGDGAKLVRDAFDLAREKAPSIIFIDELDAIGAKRQDSELSGDREVQRTMLELLNQLDGFSSDNRVKVIAATNRPDTLDPALLRSGRLDRKIELPHPNEDVNFKELARATDDFNGAQLRAVCTEAGMIAARRKATELCHEDFVEGIASVQAKKKYPFMYYS